MEIRKSDKLTNLKWLNLFDISYIATDGRQRSWQIASRSKAPKCITGRFGLPDAVIIVPFHAAEKKMVITKEYRIALADYEYGFPAGLIDPGETIEQAARRELQEETGLNIVRFIKLSPPIYSSAGMTDESVSMVYVECDGIPSTAGNQGSEMIEIQLVTRDQASKICHSPENKFDAKAWLVLARFAEKGNID